MSSPIGRTCDRESRTIGGLSRARLAPATRRADGAALFVDRDLARVPLHLHVQRERAALHADLAVEHLVAPVEVRAVNERRPELVEADRVFGAVVEVDAVERRAGRVE